MGGKFLDEETVQEGGQFLDPEQVLTAAEKPTPPGLEGIPSYEDFKANYQAAQEAPFLQKLQSKLGEAADVGVGLVSPFVKGVIPSITGPIKDVARSKNLQEVIGNLVGSQTRNLSESGRKAGLDILSIMKNLPSQFLEKATKKLESSKTPLELLTNAYSLAPGGPGGLINPLSESILGLQSRTPPEAEIQRAYDSFIESKATEAVRKTAPENELLPAGFPGKANEDVSNQGAAAIPLLLPLVGAEERLAANQLLAKPQLLASKIQGSLKKMSGRVSRATKLEDAVVKATKIAPIDNGMEIASITKTRVQQLVGKQPPTITAVGAREAVSKAQTALLEDAKAGFKLGEDQGLVVKGGDLIKRGMENIIKENPELAKVSPENVKRIDRIMRDFNHLEGEVSPTKAQEALARLNAKYDALVDKASPEASAYRAVRGGLSDQLDEIYKASTGVETAPYRDWGHLQEFNQGLENQIRSAQTSQVAGVEGGPGSIPVTPFQVKHKISKALVPKRLIPRNIEAIDKSVQTVFKDAPDLPPPRPMNKVVQSSLQNKYQANPAAASIKIPPPKIQARPTAGSQTLEQAIQEKIKSYPAELRKDPGMARAAAIGELGGAPPVPSANANIMTKKQLSDFNSNLRTLQEKYATGKLSEGELKQLRGMLDIAPYLRASP